MHIRALYDKTIYRQVRDINGQVVAQVPVRKHYVFKSHDSKIYGGFYVELDIETPDEFTVGIDRFANVIMDVQPEAVPEEVNVTYVEGGAANAQ